MKSRLGLNRRKAIGYLRRMIGSLPSVGGRPIDAELDMGLSVGLASVKNFDTDTSCVRVGAAGLSGGSKSPFAPVSSLAFTRTAVALYHEYGHYFQNYGSDKDILCMISEVSVIRNTSYYVDAWETLPHEIKAEGMGVSLAWDAMESMFPGKADACMLDYINYRANDTMYMLPAKPGAGYQSRDEVEDAFETAMDDSLHMPRKQLTRLLYYDGESSQLLMQGCKNRHITPNAYHADRLIDTMPGMNRDRMLAALVLTLHPDILDERPELVPENLTVEHEFGRSLAVSTLPDGVEPVRDVAPMRSFERLKQVLAMSDGIIETDDFNDFEFNT